MTRLDRPSKHGCIGLAVLGLLFPLAPFALALIHFAAILPDSYVDAVEKAVWFFVLGVCFAGSVAYLLVIRFVLELA